MKIETLNALVRTGFAVTLFGTVTIPGMAQEFTRPKPTATNRPSMQNPGGKAHGGNNNRGRLTGDYLWGVTNGNRTFDKPVYGRVPQETIDSPLFLDGWTYPIARAASGARVGQNANGSIRDLLFPSVLIDDEGTVGIAPINGGIDISPTGRVVIGASWLTAVSGPSTVYTGTGYHRKQAIQRPNGNPGSNPADAGKFSWYPSVAGAAGSVTRYAIRIKIPQSASDTSVEARVADARYVVYYQVPNGSGGFTRASKVCYLSQRTAGSFYLSGSDGQPAYFPMISDATYAAGGNYANGGAYADGTFRARVELDASTESPAANTFVIADQVEFVQRPQAVKATPTLVPPHGGRKVDTTQAGFIPNNYFQPLASATYAIADFINNPLDPTFTTGTETLDAINISTIFWGPESTVQPLNGTTAVAPVNARNHRPYQDSSGNLLPFFSHMQVLVPRTDYIVDPETGVPAASTDGTKSIELGSIHSVDWLTGTPIWRFPDRSYMPGGLRNPQVGTDIASKPVYQIPGIVSYDVNNDGTIVDEEVFIGSHGDNNNGGIAASVTIVPGIAVRGQVQVPVRDANGVINGTTAAPRGRYYVDQTVPTPGFAPVLNTVAFVTANNGVVYAIDPYGNNDSRYLPNADTTVLGTYRFGSTNVLWTFSPESADRGTTGTRAETLELYNRRLKTEVPVPGPFGSAAPVVAWAKADTDPTLNLLTDEPRLFFGNQNGNVYALDARADAGVNAVSNTLNALPYRKGQQTFNAKHLPNSLVLQTDPHRGELKWWFETLGAINASVAVSEVPAARTAPATVTASKGVYVTTGEGRVYALDFDGPVTKANHDANMVWDGTAGDSLTAGSAPSLPPAAGSAAALNDNIRFRNSVAALSGARPDFTEGTIRPRWTYPNRYRDISGSDNKLTEAIDASTVYPGFKLAEPSTVAGPIYSAPVLLDFPFLDPDTATLSGVRRYVVVSTNDLNADSPDSPRQGRLLLLDQEGDRKDFLTNPMPTKASAAVVPPAKAAPAAGATIYSQPVDQYVSKLGAFGRATPSWTYRHQFDTYASGVPSISKRNAPVATGVTGNPAYRTVPTIFVGGIGRVYAIDIDSATGLFLRWRGTAADQLTTLPTGAVIPSEEGTTDRLNPNDPLNPSNPLFNVGDRLTKRLGFKRILARTVPLLGDRSAIDGDLVVTGGPLINRSNAEARIAAATLTGRGAGTTTPVDVSLSTSPLRPSVPLIPTDDAPSSVYVMRSTATGAYAPFGYDITSVLFADSVFPVFDFTGMYANQDVDDPLSTTRGTLPSTTAAPALAAGTPQNTAYQYPSLFVTSRDGYLHELSTNLEGEDPSLPSVVTNPGETTAALGWATTEDPERFNDLHVYLVTRMGPGGQGSGITAVTNAYFPGRDSDYAKSRGIQQKLRTDGTGFFRFYPPLEPVIVGQTPNYGDNPRPNLKPRGLFRQLVSTVFFPKDTNTGATGFPLDQRGLFYDKRFRTTAGTNANEGGLVKLPGYSAMGEVTGSAAFDPQGPEADSERAAANTSLAPGILAAPSANVNPSGQNATWVYVAGDDGLLYAYTPVYAKRLGGIASGFVGGTIVRRTDPGEGQVKVDIFDANDFQTLFAAAQSGSPLRPRRDGEATTAPSTSNIVSRTAKGKRPFFEWGESIPIIIWDVTVRKSFDSSTPPASIPNIPASFQVTVRLTPRGGNSITRTLNLAMSGPTVSVYPYDREYTVPPIDSPAGHAPAALGMAFADFRIDGTSGLPIGPGTPIDVQVTVGPPLTVPGSDPRTGPQLVVQIIGGAFEAQIINRINPLFWAANPLGVQGFLMDTVSTANGVSPVLVGKPSGDPIAGGIGPFRTGDNAKALYPSAGATLVDPDRAGSEYSQALGNGNVIERIDADQFLSDGVGGRRRNTRFGLRLRDASGVDDLSYYVPVAASAGYINHGRTGSSDVSANQRNLRIVNRSLMNSLTNVRAEVLDDLVWRWWPANLPNADSGTDNVRRTPIGMGVDGRINPLPWETVVTEAQPWKRKALTAATGSVMALGNLSPDYTDISAASASNQGRQAVSIVINGTDAVTGGASVTAGGQDFLTNTNPGYVTNPLGAAASASAAINVKVPKYQPANLVAMHSLTSTYELPSSIDGATITTADGRVQLPRGLANRELRKWNGGSFNGEKAITPFGYTSRVRMYVDANGNGIWDAQSGEEPYRIVEVWMGVPVDMGLRAAETPVDLGGLPGGFGIQNGVLGYGGTILSGEQAGFAPPPLRAPYAPFFRPVTIQNTGNVNLWNLRASQRIETPGTATPGAGTNTYMFGMRSELVDPRFGILAFGADPNGNLPVSNLMPQVVTSLDKTFDNAWLQWMQTNPDPVFRATMDYDLGGQTVFQRYYQPLAGRHTLHKAQPNAANPSVLGIPDLPGAQNLLPYGYIAPEAAKPMVGIAIPHGTPTGVYSSRYANRNGAPPQLGVFEDHDTDPTRGYAAVPVLLPDGSISIAGPTYRGVNGVDSNLNFVYPGAQPIFPVAGETVLRGRTGITNAAGAVVGVEYQPHTNPAMELKVTVTESSITGQVPDFDLSAQVANGQLPGIDVFPILDAARRPASAISPATYRSANGRINVYFSRNADANGFALTGVGDPVKLFHSHMNWNPTLGTFVAADFGTPVADPSLNTGRWFTAPSIINGTADLRESNTSPYVLQTAPTQTNALLVWANSRLASGGDILDTIMYSRLDANGVPASVNPWFVNGDPAVRRFSPKVAFDSGTSTSMLVFHGGVPGKWRLMYSGRSSDGAGVPTDNAPDGAGRQLGEQVLTLPDSIVSASEPFATFRRMVRHNNGASPVLDVVFTGTVRTDANPDLYMARYQMLGNGRRSRLAPADLPQITNELLVQEGRELLWKARHIAWTSNLEDQASLPVVRLAKSDGTSITTNATRWQYDAATKVLYQAIAQPTGVMYIYADATAGVIRFRGVGTPTSRDQVFASYQPRLYRLTADDAADTGVTVVNDNRTLAAGTGSYSGIVRRPNATNMGAGRSWLLWQKGAEPGRPATLYMSTRRVGIDLRSLSLPVAQRLDREETVGLEVPNAPGASQFPSVASVVVAGVGAVPFDIDVLRGRIFVDAVFEGQLITVTYTAANGNALNNRVAVAVLSQIEELGGTESSTGTVPSGPQSIGQMVPMQRAVNEGQVSAFLDLFNATAGVNRVNGPAPGGDPTLETGRLWMFWTSSRGRFAKPGADGLVLPSGFDILYQTLAPNFEFPSYR